jgi:DNA-binding SARP family transcriptional activator
MTEFKVLGALEIVSAGHSRTPTVPKVRQVLAMLVLRCNQVVHLDQLIEELWDEAPPRSAVPTAQTYIYHLRKIINQGGADDPSPAMLVSKPSGYVLHVEPEQVDAEVFQRLVYQGQRHIDGGRPAEAAPLLRRGLDLWHGRALAGVSPGRVLEASVVLLEEQRLRALESRIEADLQLGRHRELIGELKWLVASHPLHEWFHGQLIAALSQVGRRSEALTAYQNLRRVLKEELGLEPRADLQRLQQQVLQAGR